MTFLLLVIGFALLVLGGEWLVRGAAALAAAANISPLVIGLTVVAFGTSAPELGVSLQAAYAGNAGVAVGNVVGSNIINVLLVLGVSAVVTPLVVAAGLIRRDLPWMVVASLVTWAMAWDGTVARWEGLVLFGALLVYLVRSIQSGRGNFDDLPEEIGEIAQTRIGKRFLAVNVGFFLSGLVSLAIGSRLLVGSAVEIATSLGVSELVVGLTVVAIGTSLPEVVTSVVASMRGQRDIAVGNVVGSNLFNLLCVLGLTAAVAPDGVPVERSAVTFDLPVMVAVALVAVPLMWTGGMIRRWEGVVFLVYLVLYNVVLVSRAIASPHSGALAWLAVVIVGVTLVPIVRSMLVNRPPPAPSEP